MLRFIGLIIVLNIVGCGAIDNAYTLDNSFVAKYQKYFKTNLFTVVIYDNASVKYANTQENEIRWPVSLKYDLSEPFQEWTMLHELVHVDQYKEKGVYKFIADYTSDAQTNNLDPLQMDLEIEADTRAHEIWEEVYGAEY